MKASGRMINEMVKEIMTYLDDGRRLEGEFKEDAFIRATNELA